VSECDRETWGTRLGRGDALHYFVRECAGSKAELSRFYLKIIYVLDMTLSQRSHRVIRWKSTVVSDDRIVSIFRVKE
jgi:hypothetical protein